MRKGLIAGVVVVLIGGVAAVLYSKSNAGRTGDFKTVPVTRGAVVEKALAIGAIRPKREIAVKSKISGIVKTSFREVGDRVSPGDPLFEILPDPTPMELTEARREVEIAQNVFDQAQKKHERARKLKEQGILATQDWDQADKDIQDARIRLELSTEKLALIEKGRVKGDNRADRVESIIRAPIAGTVLDLLVNEGDPVVPLTSYQAGTALTNLADMTTLIFKGTVDEIDVGKLAEGLPARIKIGALPEAKVEGRVYKIAPKSKTAEGATLFDVEIELLPAQGRHAARRLLGQRRDRGAREDERAAGARAAGDLRRRQGERRASREGRGPADEEGDQGRPLGRHERRGGRGPEGEGHRRRAAAEEDRVAADRPPATRTTAMNSLSFLRQMLQDVRHQKLRTLLTLFGITWGTVSVALLVSFGEGLQRRIEKNMKGLGDGIVIAWPARTSLPFQGLGKGRRCGSARTTSRPCAGRSPRRASPASTWRASSSFRRERARITPEHVGHQLGVRHDAQPDRRTRAAATSTTSTSTAGAGSSSWATSSSRTCSARPTRSAAR